MQGKYLEGHYLMGQLFDEPSPDRLIDIVENILSLDLIETDIIKRNVEVFKTRKTDQNLYDFILDVVSDRLGTVLYIE